MAPFAGVYLPRQNLQNLKINIKHFYILCYLVHEQLSVLVEMHVIIKLHKFTKLSQHFHERQLLVYIMTCPQFQLEMIIMSLFHSLHWNAIVRALSIGWKSHNYEAFNVVRPLKIISQSFHVLFSCWLFWIKQLLLRDNESLSEAREIVCHSGRVMILLEATQEVAK